MFNNLAQDFGERIYRNFDNEICKQCFQQATSNNLNLSNPQPLPYVGSIFPDDEKRLMFVGIESYSNRTRECIEDLEPDVFDTEQVENLYFGNKESGVKYSPFWEWVRVISTEIIAPKNLDKKSKLEYAFPRIAYSNLHKCQNWKAKNGSDTTTYNLFEPLSENCIQKARWIHKEIETIKPKIVIVFAGTRSLRGLDFFLARLFLCGKIRLMETYRYDNNWIKRNSRDLLLKAKNNDTRFIVTSHPQGTPNVLRNEIIRIIKENDWDGSIAVNDLEEY